MRKFFLAILALACVTLAWQPLLANDDTEKRTNSDPEAALLDQKQEAPNPWRTVRINVANDTENELALGSNPLVPPLPFYQPQLGKPVVIDRLAGDVEEWSTAFMPQSKLLAELSPIELPQTDERWVRVDISKQVAIAYEGQTPVRAFVISSGLPGYDTVIGTFYIRAKVRAQTMSGGSGRSAYNLPNVQWVQYFYQDYGFHGTYWHKEFGTPRSHGCINMTNADAKWLFDFTAPTWDGSQWQKVLPEDPGALVIVHE